MSPERLTRALKCLPDTLRRGRPAVYKYEDGGNGAPPEIVREDRRSELKTLGKRLRRKSVIFLRGEPRAGKTSLLGAIEADPSLVDVEGEVHFLNVGELYGWEREDTEEKLEELEATMREPDKELLLIDEARCFFMIRSDLPRLVADMVRDLGKKAIFADTPSGVEAIKRAGLKLPTVDLQPFPPSDGRA